MIELVCDSPLSRRQWPCVEYVLCGLWSCVYGLAIGFVLT